MAWRDLALAVACFELGWHRRNVPEMHFQLPTFMAAFSQVFYSYVNALHTIVRSESNLLYNLIASSFL